MNKFKLLGDSLLAEPDQIFIKTRNMAEISFCTIVTLVATEKEYPITDRLSSKLKEILSVSEQQNTSR